MPSPSRRRVGALIVMAVALLLPAMLPATAQARVASPQGIAQEEPAPEPTEEPEDYSQLAPGLRAMLEDLRSGRLDPTAFANHAYAKLGFLGGVPAHYRDDSLTTEERTMLGMVLGRVLEQLDHPVRQSIRNHAAEADRLQALAAGAGDVSASRTLVEGCGNDLSLLGRGRFKCLHQTPQFLIFYNVDGTNNVNPFDGPGDPFAGDVEGNGVPNNVDRTRRSLEVALAQYESLGYRAAHDDLKTVVFLGAEHIEPDNGFVPPPTIAGVDEIWIGSQFSARLEADPLYLPRHELFHVMQYSYLQLGHVLNVNIVNSFMESTAEWAAHQALKFDVAVPPGTRVRYARNLRSYFADRAQGPLPWDGFGERRQYGAFIFPEFLEERFGPDIIRQVWERIRDDNPIDALIDTIDARGSKMADELRVFGVANYQLCGSRTDADYGGSWHYSDPDVPAWCGFITGLGDDREFSHAPRPAHDTIVLPADGRTGPRIDRVAGGGRTYVDLVGTGDPSRIWNMAIRLRSARGLTTMTVIDWKVLPQRCRADQLVGPESGEVITQVGGRCNVVTIMLANGCFGCGRDLPTWETEYLSLAGGTITDSASLVEIGVQRGGNLIVPGGLPSAGTQTTEVGLRYRLTNNEAVAAVGCHCEGWGIQATLPGGAGQVSGWSHGVKGLSDNAEVLEFTTTASTARSVVQVDGIGPLIVTHDFRPSSRPELYEVRVTIEWLGDPAERPHITYRRIVDWDVEPTPLHEFVTLRADHANVEFASDHGLGDPDPGSGRPVLFNQGSFTDAGPYDQGTLLDVSVPLEDPPGPQTGNVGELILYYGAAPNQAQALDALTAVGAPVYSLAKPSEPGNPASGAPNTFILGYRPVT